MKSNLFLLLLCTLSTLFSCQNDTPDIKEDYVLVFYPRHCECITTKILSHKERPQNWYIYHPQQELQAQDADLWVVTGTDSLARIPSFKMSYSPAYYLDIMQTDSFPLAERNHKLEQQLDYDYRTKTSYSTRSQQHTRASDMMVSTNLISWEYRVTGVKDFNIVATTPLFGQAAGTSLNRHFIISDFLPKQIISYRTQSLVWGYRSKKNVETIAKWLALQPMAPPAIVFRLNATPPEVPAHVKFVSILETTDGKVLRDTTEMYLKR